MEERLKADAIGKIKSLKFMGENINIRRQSHIDSVAGLLIIHMILGHCIQVTDCRDLTLYKWMQVLSFFMPWFFFKSGMFYKDRKPVEVLLGGGKLMKPYIIWNIIGYIPFVLLLVARNDYVWYHYLLQPFKGILLNGQYSGNSPLWFLPVLLIVQIMFTYAIQKKFGVWTVIVGIILGYLCFILEIKIPSYLASISTGYFYFGMGYLMKHIQYNRSVFFVSTLIYVCFILTTISFVDINSNSVASGTYYLWPICAISGIVFINNTFLYLQKIINKIRILHYVGLHSMSFYTSHWVVIMSSLLLYNNIIVVEQTTK